MLVLTRHPNEQIDIAGGFHAGGITITIVKVKGDRVCVGIDAPIDVVVHRREVQEIIDESKQSYAE